MSITAPRKSNTFLKNFFILNDFGSESYEIL
jgi:hypothetical protein